MSTQAPREADRDPALEVTHLRKTCGDTVAFDDVSFSVAEGEIFGILGPNGAGKTTIVECSIGLRMPDSGTIRLLGLDPQVDREELHAIVGAQLQASALPARLKVGEMLDLYRSFYREPADVAELIDVLGLAEKRTQYYKSLSGGQKQRLSIALALIGRPRMALLDEMTTGLDPQARRDTWELIDGVRERCVTIVLVTHFMDKAERLCDRVALTDRGRLVAIDSPAGLAERAGGGATREREQQDAPRVGALADEPGDAVHECRRLAGAGPGNDEQRAAAVGSRGALLIVEAGEHVGVERRTGGTLAVN